MKSKVSYFLVLIGALVAFLPVLAVDWVLDGYVRVREASRLQRSVNALVGEAQAGVYDGIGALRRILSESPSLCTPTFEANVHREMLRSLVLRQVLVEDRDGAQYCDAYGRAFEYAPISNALPLPGQSELISVVQLPGMSLPAFKLTQDIGNRLVSAFLPFNPNLADGIPSNLKAARSLRFILTDGTTVASFGDEVETQDDGEMVVNGFAGEIPLRAELVVPFGNVRADYAELDVSFTIIACVMSAGFLLLALQYARRAELPGFDLERAIAAGELKPYYQPVINLRTGSMMGCEVLIRWEKRNGKLVPPSTFIDYAEMSGLAIPMTVRLMQQVRRDLDDLCAELPDFKVAINLFEGHFRDSGIVEDVQAIFGDSHFNYRQLCFEITERRPLDSEAAQSVIAGLHALGCRLAMDDAGTGHSNLTYMQTLGVDIIKIDRSFVDMVKQETEQVPVLDGLISMAKNLGAEIVAEGVETQEQATYLRARGVIMAQGYLFSPALRLSTFKPLARALNSPGKPAPASVRQAA